MTKSADSTVASPAHVNGALFPKPPRRKPIRITRQRRQRMEELVDGLLRLLDEVDGDPDDEDNGDLEPTTGPSCYDEYEPDIEEPSLGWTATTRQEGQHWLGDNNYDAEQEHDGREPQGDEVGTMNGPRHPEDDNGIGDSGGAEEQTAGRWMIEYYDGTGHAEARRMLAERGL